MSKLAAVLIAFAVAFFVAAQVHPSEHLNATETKARDTLTISTDIRVGSQILPAGKYDISCDRVKMTFTRVSDGKKVAEVVCHGREMAAKAKTTELYVSKDASGASYAEKLLLRGSNVEHTFGD